jgi:hypothetical protein
MAVDIKAIAQTAVQKAKGSTGVWAVIGTAITSTVLVILPDVMNYYTAGDVGMAAAYAVGMIVAVVIETVALEMAGDTITKS